MKSYNEVNSRELSKTIMKTNKEAYEAANRDQIIRDLVEAYREIAIKIIEILEPEDLLQVVEVAEVIINHLVPKTVLVDHTISHLNGLNNNGK